MERKNNMKYDFIIELMCTNPLKKRSDIESLIKKLIKTKADSVIAVNKLEDHHPRRIKKIVNDKIVDFCLKEKHDKEMKRKMEKNKFENEISCIYLIFTSKYTISYH